MKLEKKEIGFTALHLSSLS